LHAVSTHHKVLGKLGAATRGKGVSHRPATRNLSAGEPPHRATAATRACCRRRDGIAAAAGAPPALRCLRGHSRAQPVCGVCRTARLVRCMLHGARRGGAPDASAHNARCHEALQRGGGGAISFCWRHMAPKHPDMASLVVNHWAGSEALTEKHRMLRLLTTLVGNTPSGPDGYVRSRPRASPRGCA
jgi:hypothetical protein